MEPKQQAPYPLRMPTDLRDRLEKAAKESGRSMNSEVVARLQSSFDQVGIEEGALQALHGELEQQRSLARDFRSAADFSDNFRAAVASMLLSTLAKVPEEARTVLVDAQVTHHLAEWLSERDRRGAVFSLLRLIDGSDPEVVETLRNFASHIEDLGLERKPITLTVRGKKVGTDVYANEPESKGKPRSENKMIVVGNLGRDSEARTFPGAAEVHGVKVGGPKVPLPATPRGPVPSPNARKPGAKKKP